MKKLFVFLFSILIFSTYLYSQNNLTAYNTSWSTVLPGKVISKPAVTSFGFITYSDAKIISAFSETGKLLWEKNVSGRDVQVFSLKEDFLLEYVKSYKSISLLNPSGSEIWSKEIDFTINDAFSGRDGRIFLIGSENVECVGITGITKWKLKTELQSDLKVQELPDGSLILFLNQLVEGKTKGIRISPFGEILEEIIYSGKVFSAESCDSGIVLTFSDGTGGLFSLSDEALCENKWVLKTVKNPSDKNQIEKSFFAVNSQKDNLIYVLAFKNMLQIYKLNKINGNVLASFTISNIKGFDITSFKYSNNAIFICDDSSGYLYSDEGKELGSYKFMPQNKFRWNYIVYSNSDYLIFCGTNWTINAYKLNQIFASGTLKSKKETYNSYFPDSVSEYAFAFVDTLDRNFASQERYDALLKGNYGSKEVDWGSKLTEACIAYNSSLSSSVGNARKEKTVFDLDTAGTEFMLLQLSSFSTEQFNNYVASYLFKLNNKVLISALLNGIALNGYDPDQSILNALSVLAGRVNYKDEATLCKICDAVYSICKFMGRPAFNSKGKEILSDFLYPSYNSSTRLYARNTLKKISELDL